MQPPEVRRAVATARSVVSSLGLTAEDAVVLQNSNRLTVRLLPCDVLAQVAPAEHQVAELEVGLARRLAEVGAPVAALEPRVHPHVHERDGLVVTLWAYHAPAAAPVPAAGYADALLRLHSGLRALGAADVSAPHVTDRIASAQRLVASRDLTPALDEADRELLVGTLRDLRRVLAERRGPEQLLHGEPHPGNLLSTEHGPRFVDLETCCRGPVEFDVAHAPEDVAAHYPGLDHALLRQCRVLVLALVTSWRWDRDDQLPDGRRLGTEGLARIRAALPGSGRPAPG